MKIKLLRFAAVLLAVIALLACFPSCSASATTLLTLQADNGKTYSYSVNLFQLYLSALKGNLVAAGVTVNGHSATTDAYWNSMDTIDGQLQTLNDYYTKAALKECKATLIAQYLFDSYGLSLSETEKEAIESDLNELVQTDGNGSKTKLNSILSTYGVNYDMMREHYTCKTKLTAVQNHIYSTLGDNIKAEYLEENYVHFRQLFLADYNYVYVTDENGDIVYYDRSNNSVCYLKTDYVETVKGENVYYTDSSHSHISYDKENGTPSYKITSDGDAYETVPKTEEELKALDARADQLYNTLKTATSAEFEAAIRQEADDADAVAAYTDGYYLQKGVDYSASGEDYLYLDTLVEALETMQTGDVIKIRSAAGYHIVMKYDNTEKAYEKEENEVWFQNFASGLTANVFYELCEAYYEDITVDEAVYASAADMKRVAVNYFYY